MPRDLDPATLRWAAAEMREESARRRTLGAQCEANASGDPALDSFWNDLVLEHRAAAIALSRKAGMFSREATRTERRGHRAR